MASESARRLRVHQAEILISQVLRGGVVLSALIIGIGMVGVLVRHGNLTSAMAAPDSLAAVWQGIQAGNPVAVVMAGLLVLLATPVLRVAVSVVAFALEGDFRYVVITSLVLLILLASFALGKAGI
jgi:uncharacterized membrane protein